MIFGLFKSGSQRSAEALQSHINSLKGLDNQALGALALYCSFFRLMDIEFVSKNGSPDDFREIWALFYRPLELPLPTIERAIQNMERSLLVTDKQRRQLANNPMAQGLFGLMGAAQQTWRNTWSGCLYSEVRYLSQEMWRQISFGFPFVESSAGSILNNPIFQVSPVEAELIEAAIRLDDNGPDYLLIPDGFRLATRT